MVHAVRHGVCCRFPCRGAEAVSHGPDCLSDQREFPAGHSDRRPCCAGCAASQAVVPTCRILSFPTVAVLGHACDMPVVVNNRCLGLDSAEKLYRFRSCSSSLVVDFLVVVQRPIPMVLATEVIDTPVVLVTTGACVGPDSAEIRRDFTCAVLE